MKHNEIWKITGTQYKDMTKELLAASDLAGEIEKKAGDREARDLQIGIKPNLVCPSPADFGATTHPEIVAGIIEYLREQGYPQILIMEGSWVGDKTSDSFEYCGYRELCESMNVPFVDTQKEKSHSADCAGMELNITDIVDKVDFLINVPVLKGHCQTKMTCALKNMKGLLPNTEKRRFHKMGLHKPIAHLNTEIHQDFIVVDHICGDPDFEEGGNPMVRNTIMAAVDPVLVDSYACKILGYVKEDVEYVCMAEELGVGCGDLEKAEIRTIGDATDEEEPPRERRILEVSYAVDDADSCSACYGNLIPALYRLKEEGLLDQLHERIGIGQGQQDKTGPLGIGKCTRNFDFCIMGCPPDEDKVYEELKRYIREHQA